MKLYVGNMPFSMGEEDLRALFEAHGDVESVTLIVDRDSGRSRGFGFVEMNEDDARKAMAALADHEVGGRKLVVNEARPRKEGGGGRRGGGGGGGGRNRW